MESSVLLLLSLLWNCVNAAIYDAASHPKFISELPIPPVLKLCAGSLTQINIVETKHNYGLLEESTNNSVWTDAYGYNGILPGPTIEVQSGTKVAIKWKNNLSDQHLLRDSIDPTIHCGEVVERKKDRTFDGDCFNPETRIVTHLHGGQTSPVSDGYSESWYDNKNGDGFVGPYFQSNIFNYDIYQQAGHLWYHDHTLGITRLNMYAGLSAHWFVRDEIEAKLRLPSGKYEIPLIIEDKFFNSEGELEYPVERFNGVDGVPDGTASIVPEFFGDYILVNGKVWPKISVEARKYRFRILNACDSRFLHLFTSANVKAWIIGADQSLLHKPVNHDLKNDGLLIAPAERYDVVIDFSEAKGERIILSNTANAPFPDGDPLDPESAGLILAFDVSSQRAYDNPPLPRTLGAPFRPPGKTYRTRSVTLNEIEDEFGRVNPILGIWKNGESIVKSWHDPITEIIRVGTTEIWKIINLSEDAHPIHLHLVGFQVLGRQRWDAEAGRPEGDMYSASDIGIFYREVESQAKKDVVIVYPGTVLTIRGHFEVPGLTMWHCHILSHEDHEMMRPVLVVSNGLTPDQELHSHDWNYYQRRY